MLRQAFPEVAQGDEFEQLRKRFLSLYSERLAQDTALFAGCDTVLDTLARRNIAWGIVTNKPAFLTGPLLEALGLAQRAGCVVSGDTLAERKPHPAPLLHAAQLLALPPQQCIYVGDAQRDVQSAHAAGMQVLLALYGYLGPDDQPDTWQADAQIQSPRGNPAVAERMSTPAAAAWPVVSSPLPAPLAASAGPLHWPPRATAPSWCSSVATSSSCRDCMRKSSSSRPASH